jgi:hypothetical protein
VPNGRDVLFGGAFYFLSSNKRNVNDYFRGWGSEGAGMAVYVGLHGRTTRVWVHVVGIGKWNGLLT